MTSRGVDTALRARPSSHRWTNSPRYPDLIRKNSLRSNDFISWRILDIQEWKSRRQRTRLKRYGINDSKPDDRLNESSSCTPSSTRCFVSLVHNAGLADPKSHAIPASMIRWRRKQLKRMAARAPSIPRTSKAMRRLCPLRIDAATPKPPATKPKLQTRIWTLRGTKNNANSGSSCGNNNHVILSILHAIAQSTWGVISKQSEK